MFVKLYESWITNKGQLWYLENSGAWIRNYFWSYINAELSKPQQTGNELEFETNIKIWTKNVGIVRYNFGNRAIGIKADKELCTPKKVWNNLEEIYQCDLQEKPLYWSNLFFSLWMKITQINSSMRNGGEYLSRFTLNLKIFELRSSLGTINLLQKHWKLNYWKIWRPKSDIYSELPNAIIFSKNYNKLLKRVKEKIIFLLPIFEKLFLVALHLRYFKYILAHISRRLKYPFRHVTSCRFVVKTRYKLQYIEFALSTNVFANENLCDYL